MRAERFKVTNSGILLRPIYGTQKEFEQCGYLNMFLRDSRRQHDEPCVYALFQPNEIQAKALDRLVEKHADSIIDSYGYDNEYVVIVLRIPDELISDYLLMIEGKYSQMSEKYREVVGKKTKTGNWQYDKNIGKGLALLIVEKDPMVKQLIENEDQGGYGIEIPEGSEVWRLTDMQMETITPELLLTTGATTVVGTIEL